MLHVGCCVHVYAHAGSQGCTRLATEVGQSQATFSANIGGLVFLPSEVHGASGVIAAIIR